MKKIIFTITFLLFFIPYLFAQNYPMVSPRNNPDIIDTPSQETEIRTIRPRLYWEGPSQITAGERIILTLRASDWNAQLPSLESAPSAFFMPAVPKGVILSSQHVSSEERANGIIIKLAFIPLTAGNFYLPARTLQHENIQFDIPALNIRVISR